jgi:hypothetical protein
VLTFLSCGTEVSGDEVRYAISAEGAVDDGPVDSFENAKGWQVEFTQAQALVGPIYFYSGEARASLFDKLVGINQAYACAAHAQFQRGRTLGETPLQYGVDLLAGPSVLAEDNLGETGEIRSVELHVQNPGQVEAGNDLAAASPSATFEFAGIARKGDEEVPFETSITLPEDGTHQVVDGIATQMTLEEQAKLHLKVRLDRMFRDVDFGGLAQVARDGETVVIEAGTQAYGALLFSLRSREAFQWENSR